MSIMSLKEGTHHCSVRFCNISNTGRFLCWWC